MSPSKRPTADPIPSELPLLSLRDMVVYPLIILPLSLARDVSIHAVDHALSEERMIFLVAQRDKDKDDPTAADLYETGTVAVIMRMLKLPDERIRILVQGVCRARLKGLVANGPFLKGKLERIEDQVYGATLLEKEALLRTFKKTLERASGLEKNFPPEVLVIANNLDRFLNSVMGHPPYRLRSDGCRGKRPA